MKNILDRIQLDKNKIIVVLAIGFLVAVVDVAFIINLQIKGLKSVSAKAAKLNNDLKGLAKDLTAMQQAQKYPAPSRKVKEIISQADIPFLLQDIDAVAKKNRVRIVQIRPGSDTAGKDAKSAVGNFIPVFISLELTGGYHNFGAFINNLEQAEKFMAVETMKIIPLGSDYLQQKIDLLLKTYVKK